jgi:hypothetical protein
MNSVICSSADDLGAINPMTLAPMKRAFGRENEKVEKNFMRLDLISKKSDLHPRDSHQKRKLAFLRLSQFVIFSLRPQQHQF